MTNVKEHGEWEIYKPETTPESAPANAMFARRSDDGADWYEYVKDGFLEGTVKMTVVGDVVMAAVTDQSMLFPGGALVLEASAVPPGDPQDVFGGKVYNSANQSFSDPPEPEVDTTMADLLRRLEALEKKGP